MKQVFTVLVGSVFNIPIKSKQKSNELQEPLLEYDCIYQEKKHFMSKRRRELLVRGYIRNLSLSMKVDVPDEIVAICFQTFISFWPKQEDKGRGKRGKRRT